MPAIALTLAVLALGFSGAACGGSDKARSPEEKLAVSKAEASLMEKLGTDATGVTEVEFERPGDLWRVEVDSPEGHRCIYMAGPAKPSFGGRVELGQYQVGCRVRR